MAIHDIRKLERRLPVQQLLVLSIARFAEPVALTSVFPYLPEMIEDLNVPQDQVAKWAGIAASVFSLSQAVFAVPWGRASDKYGRKPAILVCLTGTMITSVLWGFSRTLWQAVLVRCLQGAFNGNVGIIRTTVAEMVPWKELQPRAFSVMPLVWNVGSIFGPALGGALANPKHVSPGQPLPAGAGFLDKFPYALPNLIAALLFLTGIATGILFLEESLETKRGRRDWGRELGKKLSLTAQSLALRIERFLRSGTAGEREGLLKSARPGGVQDEEMSSSQEAKAPPLPPPSISECLNRQTILNLVCYTLLATHNIAFDQLIPIFMHYPVQDHSSANPDYAPPLKFSGGFGLDSASIGLLFTLYGVSGMIIQFFIFPPMARRFGVVKCLRFCCIGMPISYFLVPFTALLPNQKSQAICGFIVMLAKGFCSTFAFPCSTILLTNSASSLRILGTLNGVATSVSAIGRAAGPAIEGAAFTIGVQRGYMILPWWLLCLIAIIAAVPVFFIVEGEGFGGDEEEIEDSDEEGEDEAADRAMQRRHSYKTGMTRLEYAPGADLEEVEEEEYEPIGHMLSRTATASSAALSDTSDAESAGAAMLPISRRESRMGSRRMSRKVSIPIGMGGMSRRFSSNLGQSLGSAGGYG